MKVKVVVSKEPFIPSGKNPLEALLSALGGCIVIYAKKYLERHSVPFNRLEVTAEAELTTENPMRLVNIKAEIDTDAQLGDKKDVFLRFVHGCPIHNTLLHTEKVDVELA